jgi:hypothetical protein
VRSSATVGIIANPASGLGIDPFASRASGNRSEEKAGMVARLLSGLGALGVRHALMLHDGSGVAASVRNVLKARVERQPWPEVEFLDLALTGSVADTHAGVARMVERGVQLIAVLGGDGTHRAVAAHCGDIPLLTLSSGTNNAFPASSEPTVAGLAGALFATGAVAPDVALSHNKRLVVRRVGSLVNHDGPLEAIALVDVCVTRQRVAAAPPASGPFDIDTLFLTFAQPDALGPSSLGAAWAPVARTASHGLWMAFSHNGGACGPDRRASDAGASVRLLAPIAPGRVEQVVLHSCERLDTGCPVVIPVTHGTIALDGEREIEIQRGDTYVVSLDWKGPLTVDVRRTLQFGAVRQYSRERLW